MQPSEYRRFNVKDVAAGDDYGAMRYALEARYRKLAGARERRPTSFSVDGGIGQLNAAIGVMQDLGLADIAMIGVAKGEERKPGLEQLFVAGEEGARRLPPDHPALHLVQQVRDEAHRFAITGHRARGARREPPRAWRTSDPSGPSDARSCSPISGDCRGDGGERRGPRACGRDQS